MHVTWLLIRIFNFNLDVCFWCSREFVLVLKFHFEFKEFDLTVDIHHTATFQLQIQHHCRDATVLSR